MWPDRGETADTLSCTPRPRHGPKVVTFRGYVPQVTSPPRPCEAALHRVSATPFPTLALDTVPRTPIPRPIVASRSPDPTRDEGCVIPYPILVRVALGALAGNTNTGLVGGTTRPTEITRPRSSCRRIGMSPSF